MAKTRNVKMRMTADSASETHISPRSIVAVSDATVAQAVNGDTFYDFGLSDSDKALILEKSREEYEKSRLKATSNMYYGRTTYFGFQPILEALLRSRGFSSRMSSELSETLIRYAYYGNKSNTTEVTLASFGLLNEFLAQDEINTVGEFFDKHWDRILPEAFKLKFTIYAHSANLLTDLSRGSLLLIRPMNRKIDQAVLEGLTKQEVIYVLNNHALQHSYSAPSNKDAPALLRNAVNEMKGEKEISVTEGYVKNLIYRIYSRKLGSMRLESALDPSRILSSFNTFIDENWYRAVTHESTKATLTTIYTNRIKGYLEFLEKHSDEFTERELFMALMLWLDDKLLSRTGKRDDIVGFLEKLMETYRDDEDTLIEAIRVMAQGAGYYENLLPTMTQWKKALEDGSFESIISMELFYEIISGAEQKRTVNERLAGFRTAFKEK